MEIYITNAHYDTRNGKKTKTFSVVFPKIEFTFRGWKLIDGKMGSFVAPPCYFVSGTAEGEQWVPFIEIGPKYKAQIFSAIFERATKAFELLDAQEEREKPKLEEKKELDLPIPDDLFSGLESNEDLKGPKVPDLKNLPPFEG